MKRFNKKTRQAGFTLIELLIVVVIIGILAAVVVPQFVSSKDDASSSAWAANLATLRGAVDLYYQQHGHYPSAKPAAGGECAGTEGAGAVNTAAAFIEQLALYTDADGFACSTRISTGTNERYIYGPYLNKAELPISVTGFNDLDVVIVGDLNLTSTETGGTGTGWKFDNVSGKLIADHVDHDHL